MRSLGHPCAVNNTFFSLWEGQKWGFFPKDRTYRAFLHNKLFFGWPRSICIIIGPVRSLAQTCAGNNTFFSLWEGQKWGFFPKDRTYRAFLHNKLFFLIAARDLHYYWASAQPCTPQYLSNLLSIKGNNRFSLRSASNGLILDDPTCRYKVTLGNRSFRASAPKTKTPQNLECTVDCRLQTKKLKTEFNEF